MHRLKRPVSGTARAAAFAAPILGLLGLQALAQSAAAPSPQTAGKRVCKPRIDWSSVAGTRSEAQRKAIDGWAAAAVATHGEGFSKWTIAGIARVGCTLTPEGHRCRAAASPCRDLNDSAGTGPKR
jgi:hypothetical protein